MAIISSYPTVTPVTDDLILIVDSSEDGNPTKTSTVQGFIDLVNEQGLPGTGTVTSVGLTTNISAFQASVSPITGSGDLTLDLNGGTSGQFLRQDGAWADLPTGTVGTVTSVSAQHAGDAFVASISGTAPAPSVDIAMSGGPTQYINGEGNLALLSSLPQGGALDQLTAGAYITVTPVPNQPQDFTVAALGTDTPYDSSTDDSKLVARDSDGYAYVRTPASGDNTTKIATTAFVQSLLVSGSQFKGGFNASTGTLDAPNTASNLYTNVTISVGDYYVVTTAGDFFNDTAIPLEVGDSVIASVASAPTLSSSDFAVIVLSDDLATENNVGLGNVVKMDLVNRRGIDVSYTTGTASVGLDIENLALITPANKTELEDYYIPVEYDDGFISLNKKIKASLINTGLTKGNTYVGNADNLPSSTSSPFIEEFSPSSFNKIGIGTILPQTKLHVKHNPPSSVIPALGAAPNTAMLGGDNFGTLFSTTSNGDGVIQQGRTDALTTEYKLLLNPKGGGVGIGTKDLTTFTETLYVDGTAYFTGIVTGANFVLSSDKRKKTKIKDLVLKNINAKWKSFETKENIGDYRVGVVAQELEETNPEFVTESADGFKAVKYIDLLIAKIAELEDRLKKAGI